MLFSAHVEQVSVCEFNSFVYRLNQYRGTREVSLLFNNAFEFVVVRCVIQVTIDPFRLFSRLRLHSPTSLLVDFHISSGREWGYPCGLYGGEK